MMDESTNERAAAVDVVVKGIGRQVNAMARMRAAIARRCAHAEPIVAAFIQRWSTARARRLAAFLLKASSAGTLANERRDLDW